MSTKKNHSSRMAIPDKAHLSFLLNTDDNDHYDHSLDMSMSMSTISMRDHSRRDSSASVLTRPKEDMHSLSHTHSRDIMLNQSSSNYHRYSNSATAPHVSYSSQTQSNPMDISDIVMTDPNGNAANSASARGVRKKRQRKFICDKCGFGFYTNSDLQKHISSVHLLLRPYQCPLCDKKFGERSNATKHFKSVHERQKNAECEICHKVFAFRDGLVRHVRLVHDNIRNFHCKYPGCGQSFKQSAHLKKHQQIHTKARHASNPPPRANTSSESQNVGNVGIISPTSGPDVSSVLK